MRHATHVVLQSLPMPKKPWEDISIDYVVGLLECEGIDTICVVVDMHSKIRHFIACQTLIDAVGSARIFLTEVVRFHELPGPNHSDRGPEFASTVWGKKCCLLGNGRWMSTLFHPQAHGQTERWSATMEQYLWEFVNHQQDDWVQSLPLDEFAENNTMSKSTMCTWFF